LKPETGNPKLLSGPLHSSQISLSLTLDLNETRTSSGMSGLSQTAEGEQRNALEGISKTQTSRRRHFNPNR
jgi:hypothetical protein